jgi:DnaK suppressor protein
MKTIDSDHFEPRLVDKQRECQAALAALDDEARGLENTEVGDPTDDATVAQGVSEALGESGLMSRTLEKVEAALRRIKDGSYGRCLACGRPIGEARLEAIPWAEYCLEDQDKLDKMPPGTPEGSTL